MIEAVFEFFSIRRLGEAEAWQFRRHNVVAIGELGNKLWKHVRRRREPVRQPHCRRLRITGLAIEHLQAIDYRSS